MHNILVRDLSFAYPGMEGHVFKDLTLTVSTGWRTALVGTNGRGKTTLLRLLHGSLQPDRGEIQIPVATHVFPVPPGDPSVSAFLAAKASAGPYMQLERQMQDLVDKLADGRAEDANAYAEVEQQYAQLGGYQIDAALSAELAALGLEPDICARPFSSLSGGEQNRALLAGAFARADAFKLIDEPTNHLDRQGRALVADYLAQKTGFLLVSHDRYFLDQSCDHVVALNPETVDVQATTYSTWRRHHQETLAAQHRDNEKARREIRAHEETAKARRAGSFAREADKTSHTDKGFIGARAARQMKRALTAERNAERAADQRRGTLINQTKSYDLRFNVQSRGSAPLLRAQDLEVTFKRSLFQPVTIAVSPGDRIVIEGPNGSGKTSLLKALLDGSAPHRGTIRRAPEMTISIARQIPLWQQGRLSNHLAEGGFDEGRFRQFMAALGVRGDVLNGDLSHLSEGQRKKVELARSIMTPAHLFLWDEPLNYLDVDTREALESAILRDRPTMLLIEHDAAFVEAVATSRVKLQPHSQATSRRS